MGFQYEQGCVINVEEGCVINVEEGCKLFYMCAEGKGG